MQYFDEILWGGGGVILFGDDVPKYSALPRPMVIK